MIAYFSRKPHAITLILRPAWIGVTLWRHGAISFLYRGDAPLQIVFGDWWKPHPEAKR